MRNTFSGYYPLTEAEFEKLWKEALIVLDANAILDLYRLPPMAREDFFSVLEHYQQRLWIPYQVGIEVQRNRFTVIADRQKNTDGALKEATAAFANLKDTVQQLKLDRYRIDLNPQETIAKLEGPIDEILGAIREAKKDELQISASDPVRDRLDQIFEGRVGPGPTSQNDIDAICAEGEKRYENKIPPGFQDAAKKDQFFVHDGTRYPSKFGDLILWKQLLSYIQANESITSVMLITSDRKSDWWWKVGEGGSRTIGPHPELKSEMKRLGNVDLFWMYTADQFLERSAEDRNEKVAEKSVQELRDIVNRTNDAPVVAFDGEFLPDFEETGPTGRAPDWVLARTNPYIAAWLQECRGPVTPSVYGPDFLVQSPQGYSVGYLVMRVPHFFKNSHVPQSVMDRIIDVKRSTNLNERFPLAVVMIVDGRPFNLVHGTKRRSQIRATLRTLAAAIGLEEIVVGAISDGRFHFIIEYPELDDSPIDGPSIFD